MFSSLLVVNFYGKFFTLSNLSNDHFLFMTSTRILNHRHNFNTKPSPTSVLSNGVTLENIVMGTSQKNLQLWWPFTILALKTCTHVHSALIKKSKQDCWGHSCSQADLLFSNTFLHPVWCPARILLMCTLDNVSSWSIKNKN